MVHSPLRRRSGAILALLLAASARPQASAQLTPLPYDQGAAGLGLALRRLGVTARVLYVTAHPDDEDNGVLMRLSRGEGIRTALLTLTRGEGGQNEIGPELFEALGVLRTEELSAVHRHDAVEQYFSRAYEFGYSFSVEETFRRWGRDETLGDVVKVVRTFRPDVILTLPLEAGGGGQHHQAAAQLAREAFRAAADPARFPEQLRHGLRPWQARKIYQGGLGGSVETRGGPPPVALPTGGFDPLLGLTWQEAGSLARASHRSQGASQLKANPGEGQGIYVLVDSEPAAHGPEADILEGVDTTLAGLLRFARDEAPSLGFLPEGLSALQARFEAVRSAFDSRAPERAVGPLAGALAELRALEDRLGREGGGAELLDRLEDEERDLVEALPLAQGVAFDVLTEDDHVVPGQSFTVTATVWNQGSLPLLVEGVTVRAPAGWTVTRIEGEARALQPGQHLRSRSEVTVPATARLSRPFWRRAGRADRYETERPEHDTLSWSPPEVTARLNYRTGGVEVSLERPALWRYEGPYVGGEKQKLVQVVPALSVRLTPAVPVVPLPGAAAKEFRVRVLQEAKGASTARVRLEAPPGWTVGPGEVSLSFRYEGEERTARFLATPPAGLKAGDFEVRAVAFREGREFREGYQPIVYHHTQERHLFLPARARGKAIEVRVRPGARVGYVMGAGDEVAEALRQLGVPTELLGPEELAYADLSRYPTILTGIRAYQTRPDLRAHHERLMKYVEQGGHLVVQYNKFEFNQIAEAPRVSGMIYSRPVRTDSPFSPYPAAVGSARVSDEDAPVTLLAPGHRLFREPNSIGPADWAGWVQERGLYFLEPRDPRYAQLLSITDPFPNNPGEKKGALVEARLGKGTWTYVGLGLFRQLPAGTPGAYRLLANLVSRPRGG